MADIIDEANDRADLFLQSALHAQKKKSLVVPAVGIGVCLTCLESVEGERRWCNAECRNEWEAKQRRA